MSPSVHSETLSSPSNRSTSTTVGVQVDDTDSALWYQAGVRSLRVNNCRLARHCFENGLEITADSILCHAGLRQTLEMLGDRAALERLPPAKVSVKLPALATSTIPLAHDAAGNADTGTEAECSLTEAAPKRLKVDPLDAEVVKMTWLGLFQTLDRVAKSTPGTRPIYLQHTHDHDCSTCGKGGNVVCCDNCPCPRV